MIAAVSFYDSIKVVHVAAVVAAFGWFAAHPLLLAAAQRATAAGAAGLHRTNAAVGPRLVSFGGALALLAGIYLALDGPYDAGDPWIAASLVILLVLLGLGGATGRRERALADLADAGGGADYGAALRRLRLLSSVGALLVLVAVFLMVTKPGA